MLDLHVATHYHLHIANACTETGISMYICLCHGFTDRQVRSAVTEGAGSTAAVFRRLDAKPRCGKCVPMVREMVDDAKSGCAGGGAPCPCGKRG
jgi:bacterioferritin-associated ferredoxin